METQHETKHLHFTYDPLTLMRLTLQMYAERHIEGKDKAKATQFAAYEFLRTMEDEELESLLERFVEDEQLEAITLDDWQKDCQILFSYIFESKRYKDLKVGYQKQGYSLTGMGVVDKTDNTFYDCGFTQHWAKIREILEEKYPEYYEAFTEIQYGYKIEEFNGITRTQLDDFIMTSFQLVGENKDLESYLD